MTDLEGFTLRAGKSARRVRDDELATNREPVWANAEQAWGEFSKAVIKTPTEELKSLFLSGWHTEEEV